MNEKCAFFFRVKYPCTSFIILSVAFLQGMCIVCFNLGAAPTLWAIR
jgi:hypothetical protein